MLRSVVITGLVLLSLGLWGRAENLSREVPPWYAESMEPLLTPLEPLLAQKPMEEAQETGGEILLFERVVQVGEDGKRRIVSRWASRAVTEAGTGALERDVNPFHRKRQKVWLGRADTLTPDGRRLPVRPEAAFIQTPQRAADSDIYNDQAEAVVIFPDVKPGSATDFVMIEEDTEARIPGQFTGMGVFAAYWPAAVMKLTVELPRAFADRLTISPLGNVPEPRREEVADGKRVRFTWEVKAVKGDRREQGRPNAGQTGPCVYFTTLKNWEEFMGWYWPQVEPKLVLGGALKAKVEEWTREAKSREEIIAALLRHASDDVRYEGLEFADGDLVPRAVNQTWENQYGDCKDKACLLAAMLEAKGIRAHPALINTDFPGRVERRSPDFRHFDHCIVAVANEGGGWMFCDPTIPGLLPGMIGSGDGEREVLLVKRDVEWARTPPHDYGVMRYRMDAAMDAAGGLSGWLRIEAEGANAANQAYLESKNSRPELLERMRRYLSGFGEGLRVVDMKQQSGRAPGAPWHIEVYFLIPGAGGQSVPFPADMNFIPVLENAQERQTPWPFWRERVEMAARIQLPAGRVPESLPTAYRKDSRYASAEAGWTWKEGVLESNFLFVAKESTVTAADWPAFSGQISALRAWLGRPLPLKEGDAPMLPKPSDGLEGFVQMPGVEGQINLLEEKYPAEGNAGLRRAALEKAISYFPGDKDMLLRAGWRLASLEVSAGQPEAALRRLDGILESCRGAAPVEEAAGADYIRGLALRKSGRGAEALGIWQKQAADEGLSGFRRTWAYWQWGRELLDNGDKAAAAETLEKGMALHGESEEMLYPLWLRARLGSGGRERVEESLKKLVASRPEQAPAMLSALLEWNGDFTAEEIRVSLEILRGLGKPESFGPHFAGLMSTAEARLVISALGPELKKQAEQVLAQHGKIFEKVKLPAEAKTTADFLKAAADLNGKARQPALAARCVFEALVRSGDGDDVASLVWDCVRYSEWLARAEAGEGTAGLLDAAFALSAALPAGNFHVRECRVLQGDVLLRRGKSAEALKILEPLAAAQPETAEEMHAELFQFLARAYEAEGRWDDALKSHERLMEGTPQNAALAAWHAACICIAAERWDEALEWIGTLRELPESARKAAPVSEQIEKLLEFSKNREEALKWWKSGKLWWARWSEAVQKAAPEKAVKKVRIAEIADLEVWGSNLSVLVQSGDLADAMDMVHSLASAARVHPYYMFEFVGILAGAGEGEPFKPLEPLCRAAVRAAQPLFPKEDKALLRLWLTNSAVMELRAQEYKNCAGLTGEFFALPAAEDDLPARVAITWLAAVADGKLPGDAAIESGRRELASKQCPEELRPNLIFLLALKLNNDGKGSEAAKLLDDQMSSVPAGHAMQPRLLALRKLVDANPNGLPRPKLTGQKGGEELSPAAFAKWVDQFKLPWLEYVNPQSVEDPVLKDAAKALDYSSGLNSRERFKAAWLLAKANRFSEQTFMTRLGANAVVVLSAVENEAALHRAVNSVASSAVWPVFDQCQLLESAAVSSIEAGALRRLKAWVNYPAVQAPPESCRPEMASLKVMSEVDILSADSLKAAGEKLDFTTDSVLTLSAVQFLARRLAAMGQTESAKQLQKKLRASARGTGGPASDTLEDIAKELNEAEIRQPLNNALREAVMKQFSECAGMEEPVEALRKAGLGTDVRLMLRQDAETARLALLWAVKHRLYRADSLDFWSLFFAHEPNCPVPFRRAMAEALVAHCPPEAIGEAVRLCSFILGSEQPEMPALREDVFGKLRKHPELSPAAEEAIRVSDLRTALKAGTPCDSLKQVAALEIPVSRAKAGAVALDAAVAREDRELAGKLLAEFTRERLHAGGLLPSALRAWKLTGDTAAWTAGAAAARPIVRSLFTEAWPSHDTIDLMRAILLVQALEEPDLIPPGLLADCGRWLRNEEMFSSVAMQLCALQKDWAACAAHAEKACAASTEAPRSYYYLGLARHHLGQPAESRAALEEYLRRVRHEPECAAARTLLGQKAPAQ